MRQGIFHPLLALAILTCLATISFSCETRFDGFGIYVGTHNQLNFDNASFVELLLDHLYSDLELRHYRIDYLPRFSPSEGEYTLACNPPDCQVSWDLMLGLLSNGTRYPDTTFMASIWSPPYYMKNNVTNTLKREYHQQFHHFMTNITQLIHTQYGITIEKVSPVNEPEYIFAPWEHTNMAPHQLCTMVNEFNDPLTSICSENAYFWVTELYMAYRTPEMICRDVCDIVATHGYALNINYTSPNFKLASYDLNAYPTRWGNKRIWMTEVSSTYGNADETQMEEASDLAINIINFLGTTCIERYYFWLPFTMGHSGESLIWGTDTNGYTELVLPKKYYVYRHFSRASNVVGRGATVVPCEDVEGLVEFPGQCLIFSGNGGNVTVFSNRISSSTSFNSTMINCTSFCCTTPTNDYECHESNESILPAESVCTCS